MRDIVHAYVILGLRKVAVLKLGLDTTLFSQPGIEIVPRYEFRPYRGDPRSVQAYIIYI